jgi:arylformamidase
MIVDLTVPLNEQTPVYPGDPAPIIATAGEVAKDGWCDHTLTIGTHIGTHIDAPMHMIEGGASLDSYPVDRFIGPGKLIKITNGDFSVVKQAILRAGDIVLLNTGTSPRYYEESYFHDFPVIPEDVAHYLVDAKVKIIGLDTGSADNEEGFPIHKILLGGDVLVIENLTNLDAITSDTFTVHALPLKLGIDGAPVRVVAEYND